MPGFSRGSAAGWPRLWNRRLKVRILLGVFHFSPTSPQLPARPAVAVAFLACPRYVGRVAGGAVVDPAPLLDRVLEDEGLTAGLDEPEASLVVRTLGDRVRAIAAATADESDARRQVEALCRRVRRMVAGGESRK